MGVSVVQDRRGQMISGRNIICLASAWDYDPTSKHQVMKILAERNNVLWVNYHGTRRPSANLNDAVKAFAKLKQFWQGPQRISDTMLQMTPLLIPGAVGGPLRWLNRKLLVRQIRSALASFAPRPTQLWTFAPDVSFLAGALDLECLLYYCVDEYAEFEGVSGQRLRRMERRLIQNCDVIITTSDALFADKRHMHPNTHLVRHGVECEHFARAMDPTTPVPDDIANLDGPVLGFFGLIREWIDTQLLASVARRRPDWSIVLIGDCCCDVAELRTLPNVHLLGRRRYEELPNYCRRFDVGLLPFRANSMTRFINPIKLREYLAAGLPVVSSGLPESKYYQPWVTLVDTADAFVSAVEHVVANPQDYPPDRIARSVSGESWRNRVSDLSQIVIGPQSSGEPIPTDRQVQAVGAAETSGEHAGDRNPLSSMQLA